MSDPREPRIGQKSTGDDEADFELAEPYEGDEDDGGRRGGRRRTRLLPMWLLIGAAVAAGAAWAISDRIGPDGSEDAGGRAPLITAQEEPIKVKPDDPGGLDVPNRDKYVYKSLADDASDAQPEQLLPPPEEPLDKPGPPDPAELGVVSVEPDLPPPGTLEVSAKGTAAPAEVTVTESAEKAQPKGTDKVAAVEPSKPAKLEPKAATQKISSQAKGRYVVQLASARDEGRAKTESQRLAKVHDDILGKLNNEILRADLGDKGIWFRIRFGAFNEKAQASATCEQLKAKNVGCLVVKN